MSLSMSHGWSDPYNPPFPNALTGNEDESEPSTGQSGKKTSAQLLLNLVRLVEKEEVAVTYEAYMEETVELMNSLIELYSRRGLLEGNVAKAGRVLSSYSQAKKNGTRDNKRNTNKKAAGGSSDLQIITGNETSAGGSDAAPVSETLIFTALTRILIGPKDVKPTNRSFSTEYDSALLVALSGELCLAISQHIQSNIRKGNPCSAAEHELLAQSGKGILAGLVSKIQSLQQDMMYHMSEIGGMSSQCLAKCLSTVQLMNDEHVSAVFSCLRAAVSLVNLFGTKLSRSTALLSDLNAVAWQLVAFPEISIQDSAARLLAALPLAGGIDRKVPSELWSMGVQDTVVMLNAIIDAVAPISKSSNHQDISLSDGVAGVLQGWLSFLRHDISNESDRVKTTRLLLRGLVFSFQHFLSRDWYGHDSGILLESRIDIDMILELIERFLSYPMSAESSFFRTKRSLRDEVVDGGLITYRSIATKVANEVKRLGHEILNCLVSSIGGSTLLPHSRRIIRMSYASLLTSCSGPIRKVMDPASAVQLEGKKRRWLHLSMALRTVAVQTVQLVAVEFGSDRTAKVDSSEHSNDAKSDGEMALTLVAGCLMEQIGAKDVDETTEETWGSLEERMALVNSCLDCLRGALSSSNGFMGFSTRSMIDSMVITCLQRFGKANTGNLFDFSSVQCRIFQLASTCVATPWNDGSSTSIVNTLKQVAIVVSVERDEMVSMEAKEALRVCDLFGVPRAPPLVFVHRTVSENSDRVETSASVIIEDIRKAQVDALQARVEMEKAEKAKALEKRQRVAEQEESNKRKRETKERINVRTIQEETVHSLAPHSTDRLVSMPTEQETKKLSLKSEKESNENDDVEVGVGSGNKGDKNSDVEESGEEELGGNESDEGFPDIVLGGPDSDDD